MSHSVTMPALGESVTEGTVTRWLKQEGEEVAVDEPLLEVSTDKVDTEIPSPAAGVLQKIVVGEDETVEVGAELAVIGDGAAGGDSSGQSSGQSSDQSSGEQQPGGGQEGAQGEPAQAQQQGDQQAAASQDQGEQQAAAAQDQGGAQYPAAPADVEQPSEQPQQAQSPQQQESTAQPAQPARPAQPSGDSADQGGGGEGTPVTMPALGESVTEGTVTRWLKQEGEEVATDEPLLEVSTDKVDTEIPSPVAGTLTKILVGEEDTVQVGAQLALIGGGGGSAAPAAAPKQE